MVWKVLQVLIFALLLVNVFRNSSSPCLPSIQQAVIESTTTTESSKSQISNLRPSEYFITPISDRVPSAGIETILVTSSTEPPFHIFAYAKKLDLVTQQIVENGVYEKDSTTALIDAIVCATAAAASNNQKPLLVLDFGANIGFHSLHMASCGAQVISFEASPDTAWLLRSSAKLNGFWQPRPTPTTPPSPDASGSSSGKLTLIPKGLSNTTSTGRLSRHKQSPGMTSFVPQSTTAFDLLAGAEGSALDVDVPLVRAQDVLQALEVDPDQYHLRFLKVDVEGFEYQALQGLDLQKYPIEYITLEFFPNLLKANGNDPTDVLVYIWEQGYRYLEFHTHRKVEDYLVVNTGSTKDAVRQWAQRLVIEGRAARGEDFHANLLARHGNVK